MNQGKERSFNFQVPNQFTFLCLFYYLFFVYKLNEIDNYRKGNNPSTQKTGDCVNSTEIQYITTLMLRAAAEKEESLE